MAHRQRPGADKTLPAGAQRQTFDRPPDGIGPIQHPHRFAVLRRRFEHIAQRRDERINAAAQILQIDEDDVACLQHRFRRLAHFAIQAEHRDAMHRIVEVLRLDHVVLLVAAQAMLRTEGGRDLDIAAGGQRIERMRQVGRDRSGMREQGDAPAVKRRSQSGFGDKAVDAEFHGCYGLGQFKRKAIGMMEIRLAGRMRQRPIGFTAVCFFEHRRKAEMKGRR